ncbi:MAG: tetratricopeptide repeat protein, partial [Deltaproteobacteria bacterium]|nr:tetratricopeptide repeat protein [Deltaproteobacteria bacterium]
PNLAEAHYNLGNAYHKKGELEKAISELKHAIAVKHDYAEAHSNLAVAFYYKGNYNLAIVHCNKAIEFGYSVNPKLLELLKPYR